MSDFSVDKQRLSYRIIGAAIEVHKQLGAGLLEKVYERALCVELAERNIAFEQQRRVSVAYKGREVGHMIADLVVENRAIIEVKAVESLLPVHESQLMTDLTLTGLPAGLLINFNVPVLRDGVKRIVM